MSDDPDFDGPACINWNHPAYEGTMGRAWHDMGMALRDLWHALPFERMLTRLVRWID